MCFSFRNPLPASADYVSSHIPPPPGRRLSGRNLDQSELTLGSKPQFHANSCLQRQCGFTKTMLSSLKVLAHLRRINKPTIRKPLFPVHLANNILVFPKRGYRVHRAEG